MNTSKIANGVFIHNLTDTKFRTMRISLNFVLPLDKTTVSQFALIPALITQSTKQCPSIDLLSKHLAGLYGASLSSSISSLGDNQIITISSGGIADKFALEDENLSETFARLICESVFDPLVNEKNEFIESNFNQEKRQLLETLEADINDKMVYVKTRLREIMYENEPCELGRYGNNETVNATENNGLRNLLTYIIENAKVEILVLGNCDFEKVKTVFTSYFSQKTEPVKLLQNTCKDIIEVKDITEEMKLSQSKVCMGFRSNLPQEKSTNIKLMVFLLGGGASSKFFLNIREKLSLCYYCSSVYDSRKSTMIVHSGVETENIQLVKNAIFKELKDVQNGAFSDEDIHFAKLAMCNSYNAVNDSLSYKESWYLSQILEDKFITPEEMVQKINAITKEDIIEAANSLKLDTIYTLKGVNVVE